MISIKRRVSRIWREIAFRWRFFWTKRRAKKAHYIDGRRRYVLINGIGHPFIIDNRGMSRYNKRAQKQHFRKCTIKNLLEEALYVTPEKGVIRA